MSDQENDYSDCDSFDCIDKYALNLSKNGKNRVKLSAQNGIIKRKLLLQSRNNCGHNYRLLDRKVSPLSERQQLAIALRLSANDSNKTMESSSPKVPPLRIVLPANSSNIASTTVCVTTPSSSGAKSVQSSASVTSTTSTTKFPYVVSSSDDTYQCESDTSVASSQRITRSSHRVAQHQNNQSHQTQTHHQTHNKERDKDKDKDKDRDREKDKDKDRDSSRTTGNGEHNHSDSEESATHNSSFNNDSQHPRKRKIRHKEGDNDNDSSSSSSSVSGIQPKEVSPFAMPSSNCYQMFLSIRKRIDKKRKEMFIVQPKAPQGFNDYLINRCSYILEGKATANKNGNSSKPTLNSPPSNLTPGSGMYELFCEQEKQRYKLKIQHLIEREKLVLSAEQEILRVHGRAARAMANQKVPLSACTILKDEEIYNYLETDNETTETATALNNNTVKVDKTPITGINNVSSNPSGLSGRARYNGRLFLSWLQDVDDKWKKIKESMLLRHRKESDSLLAMQKLEWEWKLKELGLCDVKTNPTIDEKHVTPVPVSDDFDLLPA